MKAKKNSIVLILLIIAILPFACYSNSNSVILGVNESARLVTSTGEVIFIAYDIVQSGANLLLYDNNLSLIDVMYIPVNKSVSYLNVSFYFDGLAITVYNAVIADIIRFTREITVSLKELDKIIVNTSVLSGFYFSVYVLKFYSDIRKVQVKIVSSFGSKVLLIDTGSYTEVLPRVWILIENTSSTGDFVLTVHSYYMLTLIKKKQQYIIHLLLNNNTFYVGEPVNISVFVYEKLQNGSKRKIDCILSIVVKNASGYIVANLTVIVKNGFGYVIYYFRDPGAYTIIARCSGFTTQTDIVVVERQRGINILFYVVTFAFVILLIYIIYERISQYKPIE